MKKLISSFILSSNFQSSILAKPLRAFIRMTDGIYGYSARFKTDMQAIERPHYAYCMLRAAELAKRLGLDRISAIEFGVAGGNGLAFMCAFADEVRKETGVAIDCYGFDTGKGMPRPEGPQDLPYWFQEAQYRMDVDALKRRLPQSHIVLGDIRDSIDGFLDIHDPAPIGVIFNDTDYHSSTRESFRLFDQAVRCPTAFLPRVFMYFDDIIGSENEMYGPFNGQLLAIEEYNAKQQDVRIHRNQNLLRANHLDWRWQIYYAHLFAHPDYGKYIGAGRQDQLEDLLKLQGAG